MEKEKNRRSVFGRLIVGLLTLLAWVGVLAMVLSVMSSYISPEKFVWASFFGLAFWEIVLFNVVILVLLLMMWSRRVWVAVLALLISIPGLLKSFSNGKSIEGGDFRIMSYNVQLFNDLNDSKKSTEDVAAGIAAMVREKNPDVLCVQEFNIFKPKTSRRNCILRFGEMTGMPYQYYHTKAYFCGNVIYSKYPLTPVEDTTAFGKENIYGAIAKVDAGEKGSFYVVCSHLLSFRLTNDEITMFSEPGNTKSEVQEYGKSIVAKLKRAYKERSKEVRQMLEDIPNDGRTILLCGDLNDTPISYTYQQVKRAGFTDGFVVAGRGIGHTYAGKLPLLRIDYIWGNDGIKPCAFKRLRYKGSDHYPVMMDFNLSHGL
ncbi:MAG: endonuclease/exonuclease/phosphatase family protein [Bacteroidales bacterium]|nr:endonuclease/exonuclease/phosphatase family protein [Bacteroidales bacterium]